MGSRRKVIIDTDPGVDDVLAMLLALASDPEELEILMLSVTYGNVELQSCLRNVVALFHVLEKEMEWRKSKGLPEKYGNLRNFKPIVAVGAEHALEDEILMADHFHGADGLHGVHDAHPHLTPADTWKTLFQKEPTVGSVPEERPSFSNYFTPSTTVGHKEILRILKEEPEDTVTIVAVGPLTNLALAAAEDTETFLRVKEVVVMGGAVDVEGNITPVAEFNTYADAVASARVFALTSKDPESTMPPIPDNISTLPHYPKNLRKQLKLSLFPLDITTPHLLLKGFFSQRLASVVDSGSPLAQWVHTFMIRTFEKVESLEGNGQEPGLSLHDPLTIWYVLTEHTGKWKLAPNSPEDIRIETSGQWTRGMHIRDRRFRKRPGEGDAVSVEADPGNSAVTADEVHGDEFGWMSRVRGNRIYRYVDSPGTDAFAPFLMDRLFV